MEVARKLIGKLVEDGTRTIHAILRERLMKLKSSGEGGFTRQHNFEKNMLNTMSNYRKERNIELKPCISKTTRMLYLY